MTRPYPLKLDDGGRNLSKRPLQVGDCTVRALAIVTGLPYDLVYDALAEAGRASGEGFDLTAYLNRRTHFLGSAYLHISFGRTHVTLEDVLMRYQWGGFIIDMNDHVMALIDGTVHDMIRMPLDEHVLGIWRF